jgi:phosphatidylserine/phosphatidylglycerophosphate/cardiolipin synthase-like enzyme
MPAITARFVEQGAGALANLSVSLMQYDQDLGPLPLTLPLPSRRTGADGSVAINVLPFGFPKPSSFFQLRVKTPFGREIWRSELFLVNLATKDFGTVDIPVSDLRGLLVTNLRGTVHGLEAANAVTLLIDNEVAWAQVEAGVVAASSNILLQMFYLDVGLVFLRFNPDPPALNVPTTGVRLEDLLLTVNRRTPPIEVRLMIRDAVPAPHPADTEAVVRRFFQANTPNTVAVRTYPTDLRLPMHAKVIIVDDAIGYVIGSPFLQEYFDAEAHAVDDRRRGRMSTLMGDGIAGQFKNSIKVPIHDVSCKIVGPAVTHLRDTFYEHWNRVGPSEGVSVGAPAGPSPHTSVQVVRSLPGGTFTGLPDGEKGILEAYLRVFETATQYVYLENQYFLSPDINDGIRLALRNRSSLEFIVLINNRVDLPTYPGLQRQRIGELIAAVTADGTQDRLAMFCLWIHEIGGPQRLMNGYVHSKIAIADDNWATIGSANLDGVSMNTSDFSLPFLAFADEHKRATEVNAVFYDGVAGQPASSIPRDLRLRLWAEHLGMTEAELVTLPAPHPNWRSLWRAVAQQKLIALRAAPPQITAGRVLPFLSVADPNTFLDRSGVDPKTLNVVKEVPSFDFNTGRPIP